MAQLPGGVLAGHSLSAEWLQPVSDDMNGAQLAREGALMASWSLQF